jgi:AbrB family looped-hinge helix DNA binding protein
MFMSTHHPTLEYMTTTKIGEKGQLTVPKQFRDELGLGTGAPFAVLRLGDGLVLLPEQQRFEQLCEKIGASLTASGLTSEEILATIPVVRSRLYRRRYGKESANQDNVSHKRSGSNRRK